MFPPNYANYGCGPNLKADQGIDWYNFDKTVVFDGIGNNRFHVWDLTEEPGKQMEHDYKEFFSGGLLNHVLCTMNAYEVHQALINIHRTLKPGAELIVIDMDILKVFEAYEEGRVDDIPISEGTLDERFSYAISGYGTRQSVFTPVMMKTVLEEAGFRIVEQLESSEYDTRPKESLIFKAVK